MAFHFDTHYPTPRLPVFARNAVATSHPLAAQIGLNILRQGGNAVDAAVATAAVMTVLEPVSNGLGSDAFALVWDGKQLQGLNASGRAPSEWSPDYFFKKYGDSTNAPPKRGIDSITTPGAVASWVALSARYGRLPFADLLAPAIEVAQRGYHVPVVVHQKWAAATPELRSLPGFADNFLPRGRAPNVGELFQFKAAARGLAAIAQTKGQAFYQGEIAQAICRLAATHRGCLSVADFANFQPEWVTPISHNYRGYSVHEIGPNGQGIAALMALGILNEFDMANLPVDSVASQHLQIEAMKLAFADVYRYVAEPSAMQLSSTELLDGHYLRSRAQQIDPRRALHFGSGNPNKGGTIYLSTADESGMMVSFIQSNYMGFGSGCVEPEFGISLHNRGHAFALHASGEKAHNTANVVAPNKRPFHSIIPAFLSRDGAPVMSFGVMGANMQPQGHVQTLVRMLDYQQNPQAACDAPRWRYNAGLEINVEASMNTAAVQGLQALGHQVGVIQDSYQDFGAGQFIWRMGADQTGDESVAYMAASDPRRDGQVAGY